MQPDLNALVIASLRGGVNLSDPPAFLREDQCVEALNVDFSEATVGATARGAVRIQPPSSSGNTICLFRHLPTSDQTASELFTVINNAGTAAGFYRTTVWNSITWGDAPNLTTGPYGVRCQTLHGKLFLAYPSAVDRLHVRDAGTGTVRRAGLAAPAAPAVANTGSGSYAAVIRYYRVRYTVQSGGVTLRRSEPSPVQSFTPSGTGTAARVTKPAAVSEGETHWELEASSDNVNFYRIATTVVGTTTVDDSAAVTSYAENPLSEDIGDYALLWSPKYLSADEDRLLIAGSWDQAALRSRVAWTPVYQAPGAGNDERLELDTDPYLDLDGYEGGELTGLSKALNGYVYAFKSSHIYRLVRTNNRARSYEAILVTKSTGALSDSLVSAFDAQGNPAQYFWDPILGPQRIGASGVEDCGRDIRPIVSRVNINAARPVHGMYYPDRDQVHYWVALDGASTPNYKLVFQIRDGRRSEEGVRGGWVPHDRASSTALCAALYAANVDTAAARSLSLLPVLGLPSSSTPKLLQGDVGTTDDGVLVLGSAVGKAHSPSGLLRQIGVMAATVVGPAETGRVTTVDLIRDYGRQTASEDVDLSPLSGQSHAIVPLDNARLSELRTVQIGVRSGSPVAVSSSVAFNGSSSSLARPFSSSVVDNFTIGVWAYSNVPAQLITCAMWYLGTPGLGGFGLVGTASGHYQAHYTGVALVGGTSAPIVAGTWQHVAVRRRDGSSQLFLDGVPVGSPVASAPTAPAGWLSVGALTGSPGPGYGNWFDGRVAHAFWTAQALTDDQIAALVTGGPSGEALAPILVNPGAYDAQTPPFLYYPLQGASDVQERRGLPANTLTLVTDVTSADGPSVLVAPTPWQVDVLAAQLRQEARQ